ncbi:hypothetical protein BDZ97DRAFT_1289607 [Flammula alnicola]|nr:hypothetical protein BDZ97DRAFT_1289607 [Flammula alnicola]
MVSLRFMNSNQPSGSSSEPQADGADRPNVSDKPLDVVFLQDTTGSQGPYIQAARKAIRDICDKISTTGELSKDLIRFGLIAFRDHPPQDRTYVTKNFGFTSDIDTMQKNLAGLIASGGGDGPEAQTAALADALNLEWAENAVKLVILITDSPPHGLGEVGDGFNESPDQNDPLDIARQMAERGITLFVIACEPALSKYKNAVDFYAALTQITSGRVFPLLMADKLGDYIVGTALETIETEKLISEFEQVIVNDVYGNATPVEKVTENLQEYLKAKGTKINTMAVDDVYVGSAAAMNNVALWGGAENIAKVRHRVATITEPRMQAQYASREQAPAVSFKKAEFSQAQAQRVVMQSVARNSKVTASGMFLRQGGNAASSNAPAPPS